MTRSRVVGLLEYRVGGVIGEDISKFFVQFVAGRVLLSLRDRLPSPIDWLAGA